MAEQTSGETKLKRADLKRRLPVFVWGGVFEYWARGYASRNMWRVKEVFGDYEDAVQECALIFTRCANKYNGTIDNPKWMMALFKRAVENEFNSYAVKDGRMRELPMLEEQIDHNPGFLIAAVANASEELRAFIDAFVNTPTELADLILSGNDLASITRKARRLLGISKTSHDFMAELRDILTP